jgi:hypothetical protein
VKEYRIRPVLFKGWEPQMRFCAGMRRVEFWTPLNVSGYWAEPQSFSWGETTGRRYPLSLRDARLAIERAKRINSGSLLKAA